jgi:hypothetical protein
MPFKLQYASNLFVDLHKHNYTSLVNPVCHTLSLLGNIGRPHDAKTYHFLNYCSRNWDRVLWVSGAHESTTTAGKTIPYAKALDAVKSLSQEFPNVRCLDSEEEVFSEEKTIVLGLPPDSPSIIQRAYRPSLTHTVLRTVFWSMTNPMANILFLTSAPTEKSIIPMGGSILEAPTSLWLSGNSKQNTLGIDYTGKYLIATNSCFQNASSLTRRRSYSPTAFVEIVDRTPGLSETGGKQSLQLA